MSQTPPPLISIPTASILVICCFDNFNILKYLRGCTGSQLWQAGFLVAGCGIWFPDQGSNSVPLELGAGVLNTEPPKKSLLDNFKTSPGLLCLLPTIRLHIPASTWESRSMTSDPLRAPSLLSHPGCCLPKHNTFASFLDTKLGPASGSLWELFSSVEAFPSDTPEYRSSHPSLLSLGTFPNDPMYSSPLLHASSTFYIRTLLPSRCRDHGKESRYFPYWYSHWSRSPRRTGT